MAKKKKKEIKKNKSLKFFYYGLGIFTVILVLILTAFFSRATFKKSVSQESVSEATISARAIPMATPSATPVPTPKPIIYTGFCQNIPVLMYHHVEPLDEAARKGQNSLAVDPKIFDSQMAYLVSSGYRTISVDEFVSAMFSKQRLGKVVVVTLDDGYEDAYTNAYPILSKYNIKGNLMIPTGLLGNPDYMSWDELKRMIDTGFIFAYDHTWSHANVAGLPPDKAKNEILLAKTQLQEHLGINPNIFAYPYGTESQGVVNILRDNGFIAALSTIPGVTQCDSFIMSLHRTRIGNSPLSSYGL